MVGVEPISRDRDHSVAVKSALNPLDHVADKVTDIFTVTTTS